MLVLRIAAPLRWRAVYGFYELGLSAEDDIDRTVHSVVSDDGKPLGKRLGLWDEELDADVDEACLTWCYDAGVGFCLRTVAVDAEIF